MGEMIKIKTNQQGNSGKGEERNKKMIVLEIPKYEVY